ncbi:Maf family protein [Cohnella yongneupensis]|uniref:dTTP/UTP pyrophosphatase n=1 Tax=Cohnella yongneupensis TaxID=425006 RepID=A0ABW0QYW1_9BACL
MSSNATSLHTLVLASTSPRRQELIRLLGLPVEIVPSNVDEDTPSDWTPEQIVEGLSRRKAFSVQEKIAGQASGSSIVVGSDTIVVLEREVMGKPTDTEDAIRMLKRLSGRTHEVFTGVTCVRVSDGESITSHRVTQVRMRELTDEQIKRYVATGEPMDKAGAYGLQGIGALLVESIDGDFFNVVGLPVSLVSVMLETYGISTP